MRRAEAMALTKDSIKEDHIYIKGKQNRDRIFPTDIDVLDNFLIEDIEFNIKELVRYVPFPWSAPTVPNRTVTEACKMLKLEYSLHSFRKWAINRWRDIGINTELRSLLAGHSIAVQYKHYASMANIDYFNNNLKHQFTLITHETKGQP
jgi:integrase